MRVISVNVGLPRSIPHQGGTIDTGIFKKPVNGRVRAGSSGLEGDGQADLRVHGGVNKAVYAYPVEHYDFWAHELGRNDFPQGQFGENLTVAGLTEEQVHIGDRFQIGEALVEVTQPRVPCFKLGIRMGLSGFPKRFLNSRRCGFYLRLLQAGWIGAGDEITRVGIGPEELTIREALELAFFNRQDRAGLRRALRIPALSAGWRKDFQEAVDALPREMPAGEMA